MCATVVKCQKKSVCQCLPGHFKNDGICVPQSECPQNPSTKTTSTATDAPSNPTISTTTSADNNDNEFIIVKQKERHESHEQIDLLKKSTKIPSSSPTTPEDIRYKETSPPAAKTDIPEDYGLIVISQKTNKTILKPASNPDDY
uniref:EB domain-containing protein n=1 Tax=Panagrolaimus sp. ES5 TaxID=591445 RepID=A0AC34FTV3_9BILA